MKKLCLILGLLLIPPAEAFSLKRFSVKCLKSVAVVGGAAVFARAANSSNVQLNQIRLQNNQIIQNQNQIQWQQLKQQQYQNEQRVKQIWNQPKSHI